MRQSTAIVGAIAKFDGVACGDVPMEEALQALMEAYDADAVTLETRLRSTHQMVAFNERGIDPASASEYAEYYGQISPRVIPGYDRQSAPVLHDDLIATPEELMKTEFYGDFLHRHGLRYFLSLTIDPDPDIFTALALQFRTARGPVDSHDIELAQALHPVLVQRFGDAWRRLNGTSDHFVAEDLGRRFGFTPSEAALALALMRGHSVVDHADHCGITRNTAYTHYAALKAKVGLGRQSALLRLLWDLYPGLLTA